MRPERSIAILAVGAALVVGGCNKPPPPKVEAEAQRVEALKRAQERAYGGDAMKALEQAKGLEADLNKKALESVEKAEK